MEKVQYIHASDCALIVSFGVDICETINKKVLALLKALEKEQVAGVVEIVPTYRDLCISYNPLVQTAENLIEVCKPLLNNLNHEEASEKKVVEVPVVYGGEYGLDLDYLAALHKLSPEEVIEIHSALEYRIYMVGFAPGFPYMGGLDERLHTPRREVPNPKVPSGSVGIGGKQTNVLTITGPSGWWYIGMTPLVFADVEKEDPTLFKPGDYIKFKPITPEEYELHKEKVSEQGEKQ